MPAVTERLDHPILNGINSEQKKESQPWTPAEQKLLEQALKTYPTSVPDRWDQIAACIPTRTKKECMRRYKVCFREISFEDISFFFFLLFLLHIKIYTIILQELVELVKAKKAAQVMK